VKYLLRYAFLTAAMTALAVPAGCGDGSNKVVVRDGQGDEEIITLAVVPGTATKAVGQTQRYTAIATSDDGEELDASAHVKWSSSDDGIATIDSETGVVTARSPGTVVITATVSKVVATAELIVTRPSGSGAGGAGGAASDPESGGAAGESSNSGGQVGAAGEPTVIGGAGGASGDTTAVTRIYVSSLGGEGIVPSIRIFALDAAGDVAPVASLVGPATKLNGPGQMAVAGNELFVANGEGKGILVFDVHATGNVGPLRSITGYNTTFTNFSPVGIALRGNSILVSDQGKGLMTFPTSGSGDIAPSGTIGPVFWYASHVSNSTVANEILVAVPTPSSEVRGYLVSAGAADAPLRVLKPGRAWARGVTSTPTGIFVVTSGLVEATIDDAVTVFAHDAKTNDAPLRAIAGLTKTGLREPCGVNVHAGEIYVANQSEHAIRIFDVNADGDVAPLRIIKGPRTGLRFPCGMLVATTGG